MGPELGEYLGEVETRYLALVERGFAMSSRDVGRVMRWHTDGVPLRIVLSAMDEVAKKRSSEVRDGAEGLTLGHLERTIAAAMARRAERVSLRVSEPASPYAASAESSPWRSLHAALTTAGKNAVEPTLSELRAAWLDVTEAEHAGADPWAVAQTLDERLVEVLDMALSEAERLTVDEELRSKATRLGKTASSAALTEALAFERARHLRRHFGVPELMAVLLGRGET